MPHIENLRYQKSSTDVMETRDNHGDSCSAMANGGGEIRAAREKRGWSQADLAREIGISQPAIKKIESGETVRSKFLPEIRAKLGLEPAFPPALSGSPGEYRPPPRFMDYSDTIPVFASAEGGQGTIIVTTDEIDRYPRPHSLVGIRGAYAILITGVSMIPAYKPGDHAWVNPILPPIYDAEGIFFSEDPTLGEAKATIKNLLSWTDTEWRVEQYNPGKKFALLRSTWGVYHRVVGNFRRR